MYVNMKPQRWPEGRSGRQATWKEF